MKKIITIELTEEQISRLKPKKISIELARTAFTAAADMMRVSEEDLWRDIRDIFDIPDDARPSINWTLNQISYLE